MANLAPTACCTDPDNDQNNTTGWTGWAATLTSEAGGVTGYRLKAVASGDGGGAESAAFSATGGIAYQFKVRACAAAGDYYWLQLYSSTYGQWYYSGLIVAFGVGTWNTHDIITECPSTQTDWIIYLYSSGPINSYYDNVSLYEITLIKTINGIDQANIKSINGIVMSDVKSVNGVSN